MLPRGEIRRVVVALAFVAWQQFVTVTCCQPLVDCCIERGYRVDSDVRGFRHNSTLLRSGTPLNEHFKVEFFRCQSLKSVLTDCTEVFFLHIAEEPLFEVGIANLPGVVVAEDSLNLGGRQEFTDHIED